MKHKLCVVTGTRADYGQLEELMKLIQSSKKFKLQVVVTGMHLEKRFGYTINEIKKAGFKIDKKIPIALTDDSSVGIARSTAKALEGFSRAFKELQPNLLIVLGDRYEAFAAAQAALLAKLPVAHLCGGDVTEGAYDEVMRHGLTKMSHFHFVTNKVSARRVRQLGENPRNIFTVGNPALDQIRKLKTISRKELEKKLNFKMRDKNLLITYHPETWGNTKPEKAVEELLEALDSLNEDIGLIFTKPNSDTGSSKIIKRLNSYIRVNDKAVLFDSLGQHLYLNTVLQVDAVVGNSSSGISEVPSFSKPTINIGDRQKGRIQAKSVLNCKINSKAISSTIKKALQKKLRQIQNPYGDGTSSKKIMKVLNKIDFSSIKAKKTFYDVESMS